MSRAVVVLVVALLVSCASAALVMMHPATVDSIVDFLHAHAMNGEDTQRDLARLLLHRPPFDGALVAQALVARYFVARASVAAASGVVRTSTCELYAQAATDAMSRMRAYNHPLAASARTVASFFAECVSSGAQSISYSEPAVRAMYRQFEIVAMLAPSTVDR